MAYHFKPLVPTLLHVVPASVDFQIFPLDESSLTSLDESSAT